MTEPVPSRSLALRIARGVTGLVALRQAWLIHQAVRSQRNTEPFQTRPRHRNARLLMVGDSTGVGTGVVAAECSLPGLLAAEYRRLEIVNDCRSGARVRDTIAQAEAVAGDGERFDVALVLAGGNDVLRMTATSTLKNDASRLLHALKRAADRVVWIGCADIGIAPAVLPPISWWLSWRTHKTMRQLRRVAQRHGADFIDFCDEDHTSRFASDPDTYFAADGVHPSDAAHRTCFMALQLRLRELGVRTETWRSEAQAGASQRGCAVMSMAQSP